MRIRYITKGEGLMCALSNVRGEALLATFRCVNSFGVHIQLGTEDAKHNKTMGRFPLRFDPNANDCQLSDSRS